ncbi:MAG TPA: GspH/FimT family pseudopilin [Terriglobales bacterium]|nr:GspH/FimT family pseudopilin [Terriglobales bacterium]
MGRRPEVARGFTLLELIVTLAVLGVAAAVVTPAIGRGTESLRARADVAGFAATLRHAREMAIAQQRPHRVVVDAPGHRLSIEGAPVPAGARPARDADARPAEAEGTEPPDRPKTRTLSPRLTIEPVSASEVVFDARGIASGGEFKLTSGGIAYRVTVDRLTGRVRSVRE